MPDVAGPNATGARPTAVLCTVVVATALAATATGLAAGTGVVEGWQLAARYTARLSFLTFLPFYVAPALGGALDALVRHRCAVGLAFASVHTVHLVALTTFLVVAGEAPSPIAIVLGGGGYVVMYAMVLTRHAARRGRGPAVRRLHALGPHFLWLVFALTYLNRVASSSDRSYLLFLVVALLAAGLHLGAWWRAPVAPLAERSPQ
jgi:hypothetical protein